MRSCQCRHPPDEKQARAKLRVKSWKAWGTHLGSSAKGGDDRPQVGVNQRVVAMESGAAQVEEHSSGVNLFALAGRVVAGCAYLFDYVGHDHRALLRVEHLPRDLKATLSATNQLHRLRKA